MGGGKGGKEGDVSVRMGMLREKGYDDMRDERAKEKGMVMRVRTWKDWMGKGKDSEKEKGTQGKERAGE